jgi:hypothetical protein
MQKEMSAKGHKRTSESIWPNVAYTQRETGWAALVLGVATRVFIGCVGLQGRNGLVHCLR